MTEENKQNVSSRAHSLGSVFVGNGRISPVLRAPRKTHVLLISAFLCPEGAQFRQHRKEHVVRQTLKSPGRIPAGRSRSKDTFARAIAQCPLIRSRVKCHSLLNTTVTPVSRYLELFGSRSHELIRLIATSVRLRPCY